MVCTVTVVAVLGAVPHLLQRSRLLQAEIALQNRAFIYEENQMFEG